jgi:hypothetical protein
MSIDFNNINLNHGCHTSWEKGHCALEVVARKAGLRHTDRPENENVGSSVVNGFIRSWNDSLPSDEERNRLIRPLLGLIGSIPKGSDRLELRRTFLALDWEIRVRTPAFLKAAKLNKEAAALEALPEIRNLSDLNKAELVCSAAYSAADSAAYSAAYYAADSAARSAARSAAYSAARSAADSAARSAADSAADSAARSAASSAADSAADSAAYSAAYSAARSDAYSAAYSAAEKALAETVSLIQDSAVNLIKRMIAFSEEDIEPGWTWD